MASKRTLDTDKSGPSAKRTLLHDLISQIGLDEGDYGPMPEINLDELCNQAYEQHFPQTDNQRFAEYPKEIDFKDFYLTKNGSKTIRIGTDITDFTPYILLLGDTNSKSNRIWLRLSQVEFTQLISHDILTQILNALHSSELLSPISIGHLLLCVIKNNNEFQLCIKRKNSHLKIILGDSSVTMIQRAKSLMENKLAQTMSLCTTAQNYWTEALQLTKQFCTQQGYTALNEPEISTAFLSIFTAFPHLFKQEMICYHFNFVKDKFMSFVQQ